MANSKNILYFIIQITDFSLFLLKLCQEAICNCNTQLLKTRLKANGNQQKVTAYKLQGFLRIATISNTESNNCIEIEKPRGGVHLHSGKYKNIERAMTP